MAPWSFAQTDDELEKLGKGAEGFQFNLGFQFHLKFPGKAKEALDPQSVKYAKIAALLDEWNKKVPAEIQAPFMVRGDAAKEKPVLTPEQQTTLKDLSTRFFREMDAAGLRMWDLQQFKEQFKGKNPRFGDEPVNPETAWKEQFMGIERTLMGGRTMMIMDVWKQTMLDFFRSRPEAVGVVYGQMDIGSWVKLNVDGLGFAADIDFSTVAKDPTVNKAIHDLFADNLKKASGLDMIAIDVVHTSHGLAGAEVFVGEWGKAFAEVDMLRRGKWKLIEVVRNENGYVTDIKTTEKSGKELFISKSVELETADEKKEASKPKGQKDNFDPVLEHPTLSIDMEPMLSLEMLRHAIHDIEHGPFEGGQKIIKMIKYTERSFFMISEALKNVSTQDAMLYFNLSLEEQKFMTLCEEVIKNKGDAAKIAKLLEDFTGQKMESASQVNLIVDDIVRKSKEAMLKNADQAFGYRIRQIANIEDDGKRWDEADKMLKQMNEEFAAFEETSVKVPETMKRARSLLAQIRGGKLSPTEFESKLKELEKLMEEEYKVDRSLVAKWIGDAWSGVKKFFVDRGFNEEGALKLVDKFKQRFIETLKDNTSQATQDKAKTAYEFANKLNTRLNELNDHMMKTKSGRVMSMEMINYVDNAFAIYDAWMSGKDNITAARNVAVTSATLYLQGRWPFLAVPLGFYNAYKEGSVAPAAMAVGFYMFPYLGQMYMVASLFDRIVVSNVKDNTFKVHLESMAGMAVTDGQGRVIRFKVPRAFTGLTGSPDSMETEPDIPAEGQPSIDAVKNIFYNPEFLYCPHIKYFNGLIPSSADRLGPWDLYEKKIDNLMGFFSFDNAFMGYLYNLKLFIKKQDSLKQGMDADQFFNQRQSMIDSLHNTIEDRLWLSVFNAIETSKSGEQQGVLKEYAAALDRLADSCDLEYYNTKQIDSPSLQQRVDKEIKSDPMYAESIGGKIKNVIGGNKDKYSADKSTARIAAVVYEKYISTYRTIIKVQDKLRAIMYEYGADYGIIETRSPMKGLLLGGKDGAPMLTGIPERDIEMAQKMLDAYTKRGNEVRLDLVNALGRPYNEATDKEHMKALAQWAFEFQHLSDDVPNTAKQVYGGNFDALTASTGHVNKELSLEILTQMKDRKQRYLDYLNKLKEGPALVLKLSIKGERETEESIPVPMTANLVDAKGKASPLPADVVVEWSLYDGKEAWVKVGEGATYTHAADKPGDFSYLIKLIQKKKDKTVEVDKTTWDIKVKPFNVKDPVRGIKLKVPDVVKQYDIFNVSIDIPAIIKGRIKKCDWGWDTIGASDCGGAKLQYTYALERKDKDGKPYLEDSTVISVYIDTGGKGYNYSGAQTVSKKVKFQHMSINVKATDIWEGGSGPTWFSIKRKEMKSAPRVAPWADDKVPRSYGNSYATINFKKNDPFATKVTKLEELKAYIEKENEYELSRNKSLQVKAFSVGDFKGYGVFTPASYAPGGWSDAGYRGAGASTGFSGMVMKGRAFFSVNWYANASGAFDNAEHDWMMNTIKTLAAECESIVSGASFTPDGRITRSPYTGPKLDGSDYPSVTIEPKLDTVQPGSKVTLKAVIKNDKAEYGPYTYTWSGAVDGALNASSAVLSTARPGKQSISVSVDGTTPPGSASLDVVVAPLKVRITKVSPAGDKIGIGVPVQLKADFISAVPAGRKLEYLWQPHPEEKFDPFEGKSNTTKVIFTKPGKAKVWVQVMDKTTADVYTMGESDQLEFEVIKPAFNITFSPAKAMVGQQVTAKINTGNVKLDDADYRWIPLGDNASLVKESQDGTEITFYAKNTSKVEVRVLARVKGSGEELGEAKNDFMADLYNIRTEGPKVQGPKPMIWKPGVGLVEVDKEIAVDQIVEFATVVTPQPTATLTYDWKVEQGSATISNPASRDARITASETGQVQAKVTVKDNNGIVLGSALASFNATISNEMISNGKAQQKEFDDKMLKARQAIKDGKIDEAIKLADELKAMDPKKAAPLLSELATACNKAGKDAAYERDFDLAIKRYQKALELSPNDATAKKQLEQCRKWAKEWPRVLAKGAEMDANIQKKDVPASYKSLLEINDLQFNMPGQMANKWSQQMSAKYYVLSKQCDSAYNRTQAMWTEDFKKKDFEDGLNVLQSFKAEWTHVPGFMKNIESSIGLCKDQISQQKRYYNDFQLTREKFNKGQINDVQGTARSIHHMANNYFPITDPRYQEMVDFANGMEKRQQDIIASKTKADQLKKEGQQAEASGQLDVAIGKYKESVALVPDAALEARIKKLENDLAVVTEKRNKADELWNNGEKLVKKKKTRQDGLNSMRESLTWWYDEGRVERIRQLEKEYNDDVSRVDVSGVWKHGNTETFTFTSMGDGKYTAVEKGFGNAQGTLTMAGNMGVIDYTTRQGIKGRYIITFAEDGSTGSGKWTDEKASGERIFQRISKPVVKQPDITKTDTPPTTTTPPKKKKGFLDILDDIGKGISKVDSVLTGKKPGDKTTPTTPPVDKQPPVTKQPGTPKEPGNTTTSGDDTGVPPADATVEEQIWYNGNIGGVQSGPTRSTVFTLSSPMYVTRVENYHYFNRGVKPGIISLKGSNGQTYGPWQCYGVLGQGGVQNATWVAQPKMTLPAGSYTVIDSDPSTWSHNSESGGAGFTTVWALKKGKKAPTTTKKTDDKGYTIEEVETGGGVQAGHIFITGDIDNLGFGFPKGFDVFSGSSTPSHGYPWKVDPNDPPGTDRIMVGTGAKGNNDGYSSNTSRPDNKPQAITLRCPMNGNTARSAVLQMFVDDFQAAAFGSQFTVTINGRRAGFVETVLNSLNQTGPIGKLISMKVPAEFMNEIATGTLTIYVDDATTGKGDGYAIDFVRLIIDPSAYTYTGTITGLVRRPDGQPAAGAPVSAGGIISTTTNARGEFTLNNVPAGMVSISTSYNGHHHKTITADLVSGKTIRVTIDLPPDQ